MKELNEIHILILGEDGVGKSTLITSLIKDTFVADVQHLIPEITIPPEVSIDNVTTHILDSSSHQDYRDQLNHDIHKANVICILYSCIDRETFLKIPDFWLPYLRNKDINAPIILVGTKNDLKSLSTTVKVNFEDEVLPLMKGFKNIEAVLETSAKENLNVVQLFYTAQRAVIYPIGPIYDTKDKVLTKKCSDALKRIFSLVDLDKDGLLNDLELNAFQKKCFGNILMDHELETIKETIAISEPLGIKDNNLTCYGFLYLHALFVSRGRVETVWSVLRKFHYDQDLNLDLKWVAPSLDIPNNHKVELSPNGYHFFTDVFKAYDKDNDGALNELELQELFSLCPGLISHPWQKIEFPNTTVTNQSNSVTLQGFLAIWSLTTLQDPQTTLAYLAYLGYEDNTLSGIQYASNGPVANPTGKQKHPYRVTKKNVFLCYVLGNTGCGKTSILKSFVKKSFSIDYKSTKHPFSVVHTLDVLGAEKYLVLEELGTNYESVILRDPKKLKECDWVCLVYDQADPNSFLNLLHLRERYNLEDLPYVIVAAKSDLEPVRQRMDLQPFEYCISKKIALPIKVSVKDSDMTNLFNLFASIATDKRGVIPGLNDVRRKNKGIMEFSTPVRYVIYAFGTVAMCSVTWALWKAIKGNHLNWFSGASLEWVKRLGGR